MSNHLSAIVELYQAKEILYSDLCSFINYYYTRKPNVAYQETKALHQPQYSIVTSALVDTPFIQSYLQ